MGESSRVKLAKMTGNELAGEVATIVDTAKPAQSPSGLADAGGAGEEPRLSDAVKALLIMAGCEAHPAPRHWIVTKTKVSREEEEAYARATYANRRKMRFQTAVPLRGTFEDWRREISGLVGGIGA